MMLQSPLKKTALVLVDLQNDYCHPNGTAGQRGKSIDAFQDAFKHITHLLGIAREETIPVIHAISVHSAWSQ